MCVCVCDGACAFRSTGGHISQIVSVKLMRARFVESFGLQWQLHPHKQTNMKTICCRLICMLVILFELPRPAKCGQEVS